MKTFKLSKEEYGDKYPFSVSPVRIINPKGKELYVKYGMKKYNLNGIAKSGLPLDDIWLDNQAIHGIKKSISFIFRLCKDKGF